MADPVIVEQSNSYPFASAISRVKGRPQLALATSGAPAAERLFFAGTLLRPELAAGLLLAVSEVALRRYYVPPNMLARILRAADPVVTSADGLLRFEAFSQCCGVYARADLLPDMLVAETQGKGTTNVDFNLPLRAALAKVRDRDNLDLRVTPERLAVSTPAGDAVEHKVRLPVRWVKGFAEVQALAATLVPAATLDGPEARQFLSTIPSAVKARERTWLLPGMGGLRTSQRESKDAIPTAGIGRLRAMKPLTRYAERLHIFGGENGASAFELDFGAARFTLMLSGAVATGFSGDGRLLARLARHDAGAALARVRASLAWQGAINATELAESLELPGAAVAAALSILAAEGLVGFDLRKQSFFHRVLPFDRSRLEGLNPRLKDARVLHASGAVALTPAISGTVSGTVQSADLAHRIRLSGEDFHCTCVWHARTGGSSGPCKHVLAAMLEAENRGTAAS